MTWLEETKSPQPGYLIKHFASLSQSVKYLNYSSDEFDVWNESLNISEYVGIIYLQTTKKASEF